MITIPQWLETKLVNNIYIKPLTKGRKRHQQNNVAKDSNI